MVKTTLKINGMMCSMCEAHVNDALRKALGVSDVKSSHAKGESVIISESEIPEQQIRDAVAPTGYELVSIASEPYEKKRLFHFGK